MKREVPALPGFSGNGTALRTTSASSWETGVNLWPEDAMSTMVHEKEIALADENGRRFDLVRVHAGEMPGGTWEGWIEFRSADGEVVTTERETTQSNRAGVAYWATGLEPIFLEGALRRATALARQRR
jgi:hypothetical protein